jgi:hypothetical protein
VKLLSSKKINPDAEAPSAFRILISFTRWLNTSIAIANKPKQAITIANEAKGVKMMPVRSSAAY